MSMRPVGLPVVPEQTMVVARAAFPKGSLAIRVRDRLAEVFVDEPFADAFGVRGAPGLSPGVLSLVTVLQFAEDLIDRQAAAMAVRAIDWKYALGAELTDTGFDASVLSRFRARLADNDMERVVFDRLLQHCKETGLVAAGGKQRTDSTHVISAVRDLNRLELAGESVRAALEALAVAAPAWLAGQIDVTEFAERYGPRVDGWRIPPSQTKRDRLAQVFGQDALALCRAAWADDAPVWIRQIEAVDLLRQVLVQTYLVRSDSRGRQVIKKRDADDGVPPGQLRLASPYDTDARWAAKGDDLFWCGYKIHLTESCTADADAGRVPNLITDVHTTDATVPDVKATAPIQSKLAEHGVKPAEHYLDSGYPSADLITKAMKDGIRMVTPVLLDHSTQAKAADGFDKNAFTINWKTRQVRCPAGGTSSHWNPVQQHGTDAIVITFSVLTCRDCPLQQQCTTSKIGRRMLTLRPRELHENLARARAEQKTDTWKNKYALRAGVEGTINQALDITGIRRARYRGLPKVRLQHAVSATALNLIRLDAHWTGHDRHPSRSSRLERLAYRLSA
ncbi:IS1182 family transposase [Streptomyces sp. NBC_00825]|uniref:IS1182 family transposase n=1 Tax=unclassified Streptomyces TaxID=2593676 RepID=UPI0022568CF5|nr:MULTISPECIES: IS1182 family transposase [unclassified Streptomyces]WTB51895.1 IS1182 family transposase [Streptomyces sp. NBC_00826]WTH95214.1 IS1182 family transposase [Streptomyces sp. NBC_00825]WTI03948.1 IS1182 family transposase [Streptomyces sp. NBC_00822]MCX4869537.1 IS1182 family transposase [Streptomyces sp. NBC_00906]MCX4900776.1 IS1182 family transposase [Streptomyces sp. NBC_00892]